MALPIRINISEFWEPLNEISLYKRAFDNYYLHCRGTCRNCLFIKLTSHIHTYYSSQVILFDIPLHSNLISIRIINKVQLKFHKTLQSSHCYMCIFHVKLLLFKWVAEVEEEDGCVWVNYYKCNCRRGATIPMKNSPQNTPENHRKSHNWINTESA